MNQIFFFLLISFHVCNCGLNWRIELANANVQKIFNPRQHGWLGADVDTSLLLNKNENKYLWLFGDTLVGNMAKNGDRRFETMPRNSSVILENFFLIYINFMFLF